MSSPDPIPALAEAVRQLVDSPADHAAWLSTAGHLAAAGRDDDAAHAFAALGEAACASGHAALAIAAARWLEQRGRGDRALVDKIVTTFAAGSSRIDPAARPAPAAPRGKAQAQAPAGELAAVAAAARAAVDAARAAIVAAAPARLPAPPLVHALGPRALRALIGVLRLRVVPRGSVVCDVGDAAHALYWIAAGSVAVSRGGVRLGDLRAGAFFGEIALVGGTTRTARVTSTEETLLLEIPAAEVERAATTAPQLAAVLAQHARTRLLANVLRTSPLFTLLPEADRGELLGEFTTAMVAQGERFLTRGQPNDHLWIVVAGACEVRDEAGSLATLTAGDGVGEMSLLAGGPATADVVATAPTALLRLSRDQFQAVARRYPEIQAELERLAEERGAANAAVVHPADSLIV